MKCGKCGCEGIISSFRYEVEGDTSPDTQTKVYHVQTWTCRNKKCEEYGKKLGETRTLIFDSEE